MGGAIARSLPQQVRGSFSFSQRCSMSSQPFEEKHARMVNHHHIHGQIPARQEWWLCPTNRGNGTQKAQNEAKKAQEIVFLCLFVILIVPFVYVPESVGQGGVGDIRPGIQNGTPLDQRRVKSSITDATEAVRFLPVLICKNSFGPWALLSGPRTPVIRNCALGNFSPSIPMKGIEPPSP